MYPFLLGLLFIFFTFICWREPKYGLCLIAFGLPTYLLRFDILKIPMTFLEGMILILAIVALTKQPHSFLHAWKTLPLPWKIFTIGSLVTATIALLPAPNVLAGFGVWKAYFVEPIILFFLVRVLVRDQKNLSSLFE